MRGKIYSSRDDGFRKNCHGFILSGKIISMDCFIKIEFDGVNVNLACTGQYIITTNNLFFFRNSPSTEIVALTKR